MRDWPENNNKSVNVYEGPHKESPVEVHAILLTVGVIFALGCIMVIGASLFSERLTQAILDARHDAIQWLVAYWQGH